MRLKLNLPAKPFAAFLVFLSLSLLAPVVPAQTDHAAAKPGPAPSGNRFLIIVDTSASMKSTANDTLRAVDEILVSSASGQMHPGDTLGIWTFNHDLYAGFAPLQTWSRADTNEITMRTLEFLRRQRYAKESRLDMALDGMYAVIKSSDIITVFIISNGQNPMRGTPFDDQINALYAESLKEMKKDRKPIVTVLQAKHGKIIKFTVNALPWPVVIPEVPIAIKTTETAAAPPAEAAPETKAPAPKPVSPPLVVHPAPAPAPVRVVAAPTPAPAPAPVVASPAPPPVTPQSAPTIARPGPRPLPIPRPAPQPVVAQIPSPSVEPAAVVKPGSIPQPRPIPSAISNKTIAATTELPEQNSENPAPPSTIAKPSPHTNALASATAAPSDSASAADKPVVGVMVGRPKLLLIGAIAAAALGCVLIALLIHRSRTPPGPSLISQTMNNPPRK